MNTHKSHKIMSSFDTLPVLLVSAVDDSVATGVISELIDNEVTEEYVKETQAPDRVWRLVNKYYTADVRVHALSDNGSLDLNPETIQAHIIHITEDELDVGGGVSAAERRAAAAGAGWRRCGVRLLLAEGAGAAPALGAWALRARAEVVARRARGGGGALLAPGAEDCGPARARAALHAHVWPNLVRAEGARPFFPVSLDEAEGPRDTLSVAWGGAGPGYPVERTTWATERRARRDRGDTSDDEESDASSASEAAEERRAVEQAEAFAAALGALGAAPRPAPPGAPRELRLHRAEALLAAFCRALGVDPRRA